LRIEGIVSRILVFLGGSVLLASGATAAAQSGQWTYGGIDGGAIAAFAEESSAGATVYAATAGGIFKTTDSGDHWAFLANSPAQIARLAYDASVANLYAANVYGVWRSTDHGATWAEVYQSNLRADLVCPYNGPGSTCATLVGFVAGSGSVYLAYDNTFESATGPLFYSTDAGSTWKNVAPLVPPSTLDKSLNTEMHVYSLYDMKMDSASTVYLISCNENPIVTSLFTTTNCIPLVIPPEVYASYQGPTNLWSQVGTAESVLGASWLVAVYPERDATGVVYASDGGAVYQYLCATGGQCGWTADSNAVSQQASSINNLLVDGCLNYQMLAGGDYGTQVRPFGSSAAWSDSGISQGLGNDETALNVGPMALHCGGGAFAGLAGGVWLTTDIGSTWTEKDTGLSGADVTTIAVANDSSHTVYAGTNANGIFKSVDGGATWTAFNKGLQVITPATNTAPATNAKISVNSIAIEPQNPQLVLAATSGGMFRSSDGGDNWTNIPFTTAFGEQWSSVNYVAADPVTAGTFYAGAYGNAWFAMESTDGGLTWTAQKVSNYAYNGNAFALSPSTYPMYAAGQTGVMKLSAKDQSWTNVMSGYGLAIAVDPKAANTVYTSTLDGMSKSVDGGTTWKAVSSAPGGVGSIFVDSSSTVYVAAAYPYAKTTSDGGKTYQPAPGGVWSSSDGGTTWTSLNLLTGRSVNSVIHDTATGNVYAGMQGLGVGVYSPTVAQPVLSVPLSSLSFNAVTGGNDPAAQDLTIENTGTAAMAWSVTNGQSWLSVSPSSGTLASGASDKLSVQPSSSALAAGHYSDSIVVTAPGAVNSPFTVTVNLLVQAATTQTGLSANVGTAAMGSPVTFTAKVSTVGSKAPTGSVTFLNGTTAIGSAQLNGSVAVFTTSALPSGADSMTASYGGDSDNAASVSASYIETVTAQSAAPPAFTPAAGTFSSTQIVTLTTTQGATIHYTTDGSTPSLSSTVYTSPIVVSSTETISALAGGQNFASSKVTSATYIITPGLSAAVPANSSVIISSAGDSGTATITITPTGGFAGQVDLTCAITNGPPAADATYDPTCTFGATSTLNFSGPAAQTATMTVATFAPTASLVSPADRRNDTAIETAGGFGFAAILLLLLLPARRRWTRMLMALVILVACVIPLLSGCGGGSSGGSGGGGSGGGGSQGTPGTTLGPYTITVTAKDHATGLIAATVPITVHVQ